MFLGCSPPPHPSSPGTAQPYKPPGTHFLQQNQLFFFLGLAKMSQTSLKQPPNATQLWLTVASEPFPGGRCSDLYQQGGRNSGTFDNNPERGFLGEKKQVEEMTSKLANSTSLFVLQLPQHPPAHRPPPPNIKHGIYYTWIPFTGGCSDICSSSTTEH